MSAAAPTQTLDLPIAGMDCAECARHVEQAVRAVPGVRDVTVLLAAERATVRLDPALASREQLEQAVVKAGYTVRPTVTGEAEAEATAEPAGLSRRAAQAFS